MSSYNVVTKVKVIAELCAVYLVQSSYPISSCPTVQGIIIAVSLCQVVRVIVFSQVGQCDCFVIESKGVAAEKMARRHRVPFSTFQTGRNISSVIYRLCEGMLLICVLGLF